MADREKSIKIAVFLNILFTIIEIVGGIITNSLAILSDALHDFGDSIALTASWIAERKAKKSPDSKRTFGYQRISLFSSVFAAIVLLFGSLFILSEAVPRLINPEHVNGKGMMIIAVIGIALNGLGFLRLKKGHSQNEKILSWHLLEDVLGWVAILIGGIIISFWDIHIIDPILTIGIMVFVMWGVFKNLKETINIFLQGVPEHIDMEKIRQSMLSVNGVKGVHDIHVWSLEGETDILSAHVVVGENILKNSDEIRMIIKGKLKEHHIEHSTLEIESEHFCSGKECETDDLKGER